MWKLRNYRVTFGGEKIDYRSNFSDCREQIGIINTIIDALKSFGVKDVWWFFEPYVEITWLEEELHNGESLNIVKSILDKFNIKNYKISTPKDGEFADWYCCSDLEKEFGARSYARSAELALLFYELDDSIELGKGLENQYMRRCHVLANQLAFNYKQEGILLIKRGILALLFWFLGHHKAIWVYTKILRQKY